MAGMPSFSQILDARKGIPTKALATRAMPDALSVYNRSLSKPTAFQIVDPSEWMAQKSVAFNRYQMDFINDTGATIQPYTERQLENVYFTSVYLHAAIRRIANLISRALIIAEVKQGDKWERAPDNLLINRIFAEEGAEIQSRMYLNYAIYGMCAAYKTKSKKAVFEEMRDEPIYDYAEGAMHGLHVLDKPFFEPEEDMSSTDIKGMYIQSDSDFLKGRSRLMREEFVYFSDWNPRHYHRSRSLVSVAIHQAVTNATIARWASDYFTRGAMPMLIVSLANEDPNDMAPVDLLALKHKFEQQMQGEGESLRTRFMDRKVEVNQVGIPADQVAAPELDAAALKGISATIGIEPDLIVAPEGGTQERHEQMLMQVWTDTVIPWFERGLLPALNKDLGLPKNMRLSLDVSHISELEARRADKAASEVSIFQNNLERANEARKRLNMPPDPDFGDWLWNGVTQTLMSPKKLKLMDSITDEKLFTQIIGAWDAFLIKRSAALQMMGKQLAPGEKDGYKFEITPQEQQSAFGALRSFLENRQLNDEIQALLTPPKTDSLTDLPPAYTVTAGSSNGSSATVFAGSPTTSGEVSVVSQPPVSELIQGGEVYSNLWLGGDVVLTDIQNQLRAVAPFLEFEEPSHFHVTLTHAAFVETSQLDKVLALLPDRAQGFDLWAGPIEVWDSEGQAVVVLRVTLDASLAALQSKVAQAFRAYGIELSSYSAPGAFKAHVTLAHIPGGSSIIPPVCRAILRPQKAVVQKEPYNTVCEISLHYPPPPTPPKQLPPSRGDMESELEHVEQARRRYTGLLKAWQESGRIPETLPSRIIDCVKEYAGYSDVWEAAARAVEAGWLDNDSAPDENPIRMYLKGRAMQETAQGELEAWEKVALRNLNKAKRFEVKALSLTLEQDIKQQLEALNKGEYGTILTVFSRARKALEDNPPGTLSEDELEAWVAQIESIGDPELLRLIQEEQGDEEKRTDGVRADDGAEGSRADTADLSGRVGDAPGDTGSGGGNEGRGDTGTPPGTAEGSADESQPQDEGG